MPSTDSRPIDFLRREPNPNPNPIHVLNVEIQGQSHFLELKPRQPDTESPRKVDNVEDHEFIRSSQFRMACKRSRVTWQRSSSDSSNPMNGTIYLDLEGYETTAMKDIRPPGTEDSAKVIAPQPPQLPQESVDDFLKRVRRILREEAEEEIRRKVATQRMQQAEKAWTIKQANTAAQNARQRLLGDHHDDLVARFRGVAAADPADRENLFQQVLATLQRNTNYSKTIRGIIEGIDGPRR